jgi:hypothetical protein
MQDQERADSLAAHGCKGQGGWKGKGSDVQGVCVQYCGSLIVLEYGSPLTSRDDAVAGSAPVTSTLSAARVGTPLRARLDR